jgi:adenosylcobinamide-GDP ribazoletransferase
VAIAREIRAAVGAVAGVPALTRELPREALVGGLLFYPIVGALVGGLAAVAARLAGRFGALAAAVAAVGVLALASRGATLRDLVAAGWIVPTAVLGAKLWAVAELPADARTLALPLAGMLGRWAVVVQCYGGSPAAARGLAAQLVGRARLREFGWASAVAFGTTLAALDAVGLVVLLAATLTTVGIRVLAYRRWGGVNGRVLGASSEMVELVVLGALAGLAR